MKRHLDNASAAPAPAAKRQALPATEFPPTPRSPTFDDDDDDDSSPSSNPSSGDEDGGAVQPGACRSVHAFECVHKIDAGAYGVVFKARDKLSGCVFALKKVSLSENHMGFPVASLREVNLLLALRHANVVRLLEMVVDEEEDDCVFMVMEHLQVDMKTFLRQQTQPLQMAVVKSLMRQLLQGVAYLHDNWVMHRDIKTSNLLFGAEDGSGTLKIGDFGLARRYGNPPGRYTELVVTLWYRAPELLLGADRYTTAIDMWSVGCVMYELLTRDPLFAGRGEMGQILKIHSVLGTPSEAIWPGYSELKHVKTFEFKQQPHNKLRAMVHNRVSDVGYDLLAKLLTYDPEQRISAHAALDHAWFTESPVAASDDDMRRFLAVYSNRSSSSSSSVKVVNRKKVHR